MQVLCTGGPIVTYAINWRVELEMSGEDDQDVLTDHVVVCHQCDAEKMTALLR